MQMMDVGKREVFDLRAPTAPPLRRYVDMVAWSGVDVNCAGDLKCVLDGPCILWYDGIRHNLCLVLQLPSQL